MAVKIYKNGQFRDLHGQKIFQNGSWVTLPSVARIHLNNTWYPLGTGPVFMQPETLQPAQYYIDLNGYLRTFDSGYSSQIFDNNGMWTAISGKESCMGIRDGRLFKIVNGSLQQVGNSALWTAISTPQNCGAGYSYGICDGKLYYITPGGELNQVGTLSGWTIITGYGEYAQGSYSSVGLYGYGICHGRLYYLNNGVAAQIGSFEDWTTISGYSQPSGDYKCIAFAIRTGKLYALVGESCYQFGQYSDWTAVSGCCYNTWDIATGTACISALAIRAGALYKLNAVNGAGGSMAEYTLIPSLSIYISSNQLYLGDYTPKQICGAGKAYSYGCVLTADGVVFAVNLQSGDLNVVGSNLNAVAIAGTYFERSGYSSITIGLMAYESNGAYQTIPIEIRKY